MDRPIKGRPMPAPCHWARWFEDLRLEEGFVLMPRAKIAVAAVTEDPEDMVSFELLFDMATVGGDDDGEIYSIVVDEYEQWWLKEG